MNNLLGELVAYIERYLTGALDARELELWTTANMGRLLETRDGIITRLVNGLDVAFIDFHDELVDQAELYSKVEALLGEAMTYTIDYIEDGRPEHMVRDTSNDASVEVDMSHLFRTVTNLRLQHEFV